MNRKKEEKNFTRKSDDQNENKTINTEKNGHLLAKMIGEKKANDTCERHFSRKNKTLVAIVENDRNQLID